MSMLFSGSVQNSSSSSSWPFLAASMNRDGLSCVPSGTGGTLASQPGGPTLAAAVDDDDDDEDDDAAGGVGMARGLAGAAVALAVLLAAPAERGGGCGISRRGCAAGDAGARPAAYRATIATQREHARPRGTAYR